ATRRIAERCRAVGRFPSLALSPLNLIAGHYRPSATLLKSRYMLMTHTVVDIGAWALSGGIESLTALH
ncbi:MAG: hypothetical protein ACLFS2_08520, partial [Halochromatium sp.]|uniref:hypothetical protein n=1 Tax=Halochromatium sp. TaxID=2049430 RepID=UPI0039787FF1